MYLLQFYNFSSDRIIRLISKIYLYGRIYFVTALLNMYSATVFITTSSNV